MTETTDIESPKKENLKKPNPIVRGFRKFGSYLELRGEKTPFSRLAKVHALAAAGDAMIILTLADSVFFSIDPSDARIRVLLLLLLTFAPFVFVAPIIGPALDSFKGGRRMLVIILNALRVLTALLMIGRQDSIFLFPLAFLVLVLGKGYSVAKASIVPYTTEDKQELVEKNSKLAVLSPIAGAIGIVLGFCLSLLFGTSAVLVLAAITWSWATIASFQLPSIKIQEESLAATRMEDEGDTGKRRTKGFFYLMLGGAKTKGLLATTNAMAMLRVLQGFMLFLFAFGFRGGTDGTDLSGTGTAVGAGSRNIFGFEVATDQVESPARLGILVAIIAIATLIGSAIAPKLRRAGKEENIILGGLATVAILGITIIWLNVYMAALILSLLMGISVASSKVGFDSAAQKGISDADYGKSFGGFETYFQMVWIVGAILPVAIPIPPRVGYLLMGIAAFVTWIFYLLKRKAVDEPEPDPTPVGFSLPNPDEPTKDPVIPTPLG